MSNETLSIAFEWDDFGALLKIMTTLKSIGEREPSIGTFFLSLKRIIFMLLQYDVRVPKKCSLQVIIFLLTEFFLSIFLVRFFWSGFIVLSLQLK